MTALLIVQLNWDIFKVSHDYLLFAVLQCALNHCITDLLLLLQLSLQNAELTHWILGNLLEWSYLIMNPNLNDCHSESTVKNNTVLVN